MLDVHLDNERARLRKLEIEREISEKHARLLEKYPPKPCNCDHCRSKRA